MQRALSRMGATVAAGRVARLRWRRSWPCRLPGASAVAGWRSAPTGPVAGHGQAGHYGPAANGLGDDGVLRVLWGEGRSVRMAHMTARGRVLRRFVVARKADPVVEADARRAAPRRANRRPIRRRRPDRRRQLRPDRQAPAHPTVPRHHEQQQQVAADLARQERRRVVLDRVRLQRAVECFGRPDLPDGSHRPAAARDAGRAGTGATTARSPTAPAVSWWSAGTSAGETTRRSSFARCPPTGG